MPENWRAARTKPEIALAEIDRIRAAGVRFGTVLSDADYGLSASFRQGLDARGLKWAVEIPKHQKVYPNNVRLAFPIAGRGRPRKRQIPDQLSAPAEDVLTRKVATRQLAQKEPKSLWRPPSPPCACGSPMVRHNASMTTACSTCRARRPGSPASVEPRASANTIFPNLPPDADLKTLGAAIKARWVCEQAHQQPEEELGLDHFEGRSWCGLHRHALMTMIAYAYLQSRRLAKASGGKKIRHGPPSRHCLRSAAPSSPFSLARHPIDVPIAGEPSEDASNKSANVVLS